MKRSKRIFIQGHTFIHLLIYYVTFKYYFENKSMLLLNQNINYIKTLTSINYQFLAPQKQNHIQAVHESRREETP